MNVHEKALLVFVLSPKARAAADPKALAQADAALGLDVEAGDLVRSYDFPDAIKDVDRPSSYVEGTVVRITGAREGCQRYEIRVLRACRGDGSARSIADNETLVWPPVNFTPTSLGGLTHGVRKLS